MNVTQQSLYRNELAGLTVIGLLILVLFGWAARTELSGAVIANGIVAVKGHSKDIQHLEGGIVRSINFAEGDYVKAGSVVVRLDQSLSKARLAIIESQIVELTAEQARLDAEHDNAKNIPHVKFAPRYAETDAFNQAMKGQRKLLAAIRETTQKKKNQFQEQIVQTQSAIAGFEAKIIASEKLLKLNRTELSIVKTLKRGGLTLRNRVVGIEKDLASLEGQKGQQISGISRLKRKINEINLKILEITEQKKTETIARQAEVRAKLANLHEQMNYELIRMRQAEITSPISGYIHNLQIHTVGGIIQSGVTLMTMVPSKDNLVARVKVRPQDIDQIYMGQKVRLRLKTLNGRAAPEIPGVVRVIGADQSIDSKNDMSFFKVEIEGDFSTIDKRNADHIKPGTPIDAFITTDNKTVLAYLISPITEQFGRAMRQ